MKKLLYLFRITILTEGCFDGLGGGGTSIALKRFPSPDGSTDAILFERQGGATTSNTLRVSLLTSADSLDKTDLGNTFVVDSNHGEGVLSENTVRLKWKSNDTLEISYSKNLRHFAQENKVGKVTVLYSVF